MQTADPTPKATLLSYFPEQIQTVIKAYAAEVALPSEAVVQLAIGYFLESADINVDTGDQNAPSTLSHKTLLAHLPLALQKGIEQYAAEIEFPSEAVVELAVTFLLDPDATSFEDCQIGVQREQVYLLQQYREAHQAEAA